MCKMYDIKHISSYTVSISSGNIVINASMKTGITHKLKIPESVFIQDFALSEIAELKYDNYHKWIKCRGKKIKYAKIVEKYLCLHQPAAISEIETQIGYDDFLDKPLKSDEREVSAVTIPNIEKTVAFMFDDDVLVFITTNGYTHRIENPEKYVISTVFKRDDYLLLQLRKYKKKNSAHANQMILRLTAPTPRKNRYERTPSPIRK